MAKARVNGGAVAEARAPWPASKMEKRAIGKLKPFERNARTHSDAQVDEVVRSIQAFGWTMPVLIDEGDGILAGHARVLAATKLNLETVPVLVARGWTDVQKRSYIIADNKIGLNSGWDWDMLALEVGDLREMGGDLALAGFTELELANLLAEPTEAERALVHADPDEDATWPTLEIKMPPGIFDRVRAKMDGEGEADVPDWVRLAKLLEVPVDG